jgi:hypothetical protein
MLPWQHERRSRPFAPVRWFDSLWVVRIQFASRETRASIMRKLRFDTRAQLVNYALANGLIGPT